MMAPRGRNWIVGDIVIMLRFDMFVGWGFKYVQDEEEVQVQDRLFLFLKVGVVGGEERRSG